jgi:hypothetical protein
MFEQILFSYNILPKNKKSLITKKVNCISRVTADMVVAAADMVVAAAVMAEVKEVFILFYSVKIQ